MGRDDLQVRTIDPPKVWGSGQDRERGVDVVSVKFDLMGWPASLWTRGYRRLRELGWRTLPNFMLVDRYIRYFRRVPRLWHPRTFTEKVLVRLLFDRSPRLTLFADKVAVREYVAERLGGTEHLTTLYAVIGEPNQIRDLNLPIPFVMKPNHLSGAIEIVKDAATVDRGELETLAASWLRRNYFHEHGEWAYRDIKPRVLFEELLDSEGGTPVDYKFHCFDGEPRFLTLISGRFRGGLVLDIYDMEFHPLPVRLEDLAVSVPQITVPRRTSPRCLRSRGGSPKASATSVSISTTSRAELCSESLRTIPGPAC